MKRSLLLILSLFVAVLVISCESGDSTNGALVEPLGSNGSPSDPTPAVGAKLPAGEIELNWSAPELGDETFSYDLIVETEDGKTTVISGLTEPSYKVSFDPNVSVKWHVIALGKRGNEVTGPDWRFQVREIELNGYTGGMGQPCQRCHAAAVASWAETAHRNAYSDLDPDSRSNLYCLQCHVTGWDSPVSNGDTEITEFGPDTTGYDDAWAAGQEIRMVAMEAVQCEACHGATGPIGSSHSPKVSFSTHDDENDESTSSCSPCHLGQLDEWRESEHAMFQDGDVQFFNEEHYTHNPSCDGCHTSEGFIRDHDPAFANYEFPENQSFIGCATCHDPHAAGNHSQLRDLGDIQLNFVPDGVDEIPTISGFGTGQICVQCHHGRRTNENVMGQIDNGSGHFGPHGSPEGDMFIGNGCYEIPGYTYYRLNSGVNHTMIQDGCVGCHMVRETFVHGEIQDHSFHTLRVETGSCTNCHANMTDYESYSQALADEITPKLDQIAVLCGYTDIEDFEENWDFENTEKERWQREIGYAAVFVLEDGSMGVHNPTYAHSLLDNAITYGNSR